MIIVYTGTGKGKTSASVGQCLRALGQGMRVAFCQFMKRDGQAGEQAMLKELLGPDFLAGGLGFFRNKSDYPAHRAAALKVLDWAGKRLDPEDQANRADMLVLDEILYALGAGLIKREEVERLITLAEAGRTHLVLSGRGLPDWLQARVDLATRMDSLKHPHESGEKPRPGIEF